MLALHARAHQLCVGNTSGMLKVKNAANLLWGFEAR